MPDSQEIIESLLRQHTAVTFQAFGPSMNPTIRNGENVRVRPVGTRRPRPGSVILCRFCGRLVVHRLIRNDEATGRCFLAADAALKGGDWVPAVDILGLAESVRRGARECRLDPLPARLAGLLRYVLRPLRRALWNYRQTHHAHTPARWYK